MCPWWTRMWNLDFRSDDSRFRVQLPKSTVRRMLKWCRSSAKSETGGILIGWYSEALDCAHVSVASGPPLDSDRGPSWFKRGTRGGQSLLNSRWAFHREHYLGEWHFHPFSSPAPSGTDIGQMQSIASTPEYGCPEPLLLIIGGDPVGEWSVSVHVVPKGREAIPLGRV
jgi:integrative and conjugative element protein (TIGR02256 family)